MYLTLRRLLRQSWRLGVFYGYHGIWPHLHRFRQIWRNGKWAPESLDLLMENAEIMSSKVDINPTSALLSPVPEIPGDDLSIFGVRSDKSFM